MAAEITIRVSGRSVHMEVSEAEAKKVLDELLFSRQELKTVVESGSKGGIYTETEAEVSGSDFHPVPSREEVEAFITSQPDYRHSVESIAEHFAQKRVSSADGRAAELWLNSIRGHGNRVRDSIEKNEIGKWEFERRVRQKIFRFVKQEEGNISTSPNQRVSQFEQKGAESQNQE